MRLSLACALYAGYFCPLLGPHALTPTEPEVLMLDEPTNHLDLPAILWLQQFLTDDYNQSILVVVSHDRGIDGNFIVYSLISQRVFERCGHRHSTFFTQKT